MSDEPKVLTRLDEGILEIVLNRPEVRNAIDKSMEEEIELILDEADADEKVRAVTLTGAGKVFSAGHDLRAAIHKFIDGGPGPKPHRSLPRSWYFSKPFIVGVHGFVGPAGFEITAPSDFIIAGEGTKWSFEIIRAGGVAPNGAFMILHQQLPMRVLNKLWMMGGYFLAEEALEWNFVQRVVPEDQVVAETRRWAEQAAQIPHEQYSAAKASLRRVYEIFGLNAAVGVQNMQSGHGSKVDVDFWNLVEEKGLKSALAKRDAGFDDDVARV